MGIDWLHRLTRLRVNVNRTKWSQATTGCAPHKPFLLLSIMDLSATGQIVSPLIEPSFDLMERFARYWSLVMPPGTKCNMAYPFYHMQSDGFWRLIPKPGRENELGEKITSSMSRVQDTVLGGELDPQLFQQILEQKRREELRVTLLNRYFAPNVRQLLLREAMDNQEAYECSQRLLQAAEEAIPYGQTDKPQQVRDQGFRKAIMDLYSHRCALCGIRMITPEGHTIVKAAHIRPWSETRDDRPANGLALCKLCHWSFDRGWFFDADCGI